MTSHILQHKKKRLGSQKTPDLSLGHIDLQSNRPALFEHSSRTGGEGCVQPNRSLNTIAADDGWDSTKQAQGATMAKLLSPKRSKDYSTATYFASTKQRSGLNKASMSGVFVAGSRINSPSEASQRFRPSLVTTLATRQTGNPPVAQGLGSPHFPTVAASRSTAKNLSAFVPSALVGNASRARRLLPAHPRLGPDCIVPASRSTSC